MVERSLHKAMVASPILAVGTKLKIENNYAGVVQPGLECSPVTGEIRGSNPLARALSTWYHATPSPDYSGEKVHDPYTSPQRDLNFLRKTHQDISTNARQITVLKQ